jgi:hypothetical protein
MGKGSGNGPPRLAGKHFTFWAHKMANYLQAQHHDAWRTTMYPLPMVPTEGEAKWNAHARNHIFKALDEELFDQVFALQTAMKCGWNSRRSMWVTKRSVRKNMSCSSWNSLSSK